MIYRPNFQTLNKRYWLLGASGGKPETSSFVEGPLLFDSMAITSSMVYARVLFEDCIWGGCCVGWDAGCWTWGWLIRQGSLSWTLYYRVWMLSKLGFGPLLKRKKEELFMTFMSWMTISLYRERINRVSIWGLSWQPLLDLIITPRMRGFQKSECQQPRRIRWGIHALVTKQDWEALWYLSAPVAPGARPAASSEFSYGRSPFGFESTKALLTPWA